MPISLFGSAELSCMPDNSTNGCQAFGITPFLTLMNGISPTFAHCCCQRQQRPFEWDKSRIEADMTASPMPVIQWGE
jgi:hypothetical protein